ncbi:putative TIR domain, winged helix-turn-helix DNA-binding domain-containing protein [Rosa chinensis]|uniref:Putative TIR domain, winged helix-turn-helix DNA-binding domain-containing protein n=1 Tax=Rosa chinensis TaxID=74649 RepID=A0A2P6PE21_ROSCH|nr:disease resistance protein RUN1 [Rosa chinensis]PRQ20173.1 putative TIR domain, winged helix-turn-helix DNA-binding domain-containing protein [Rosa chinensis]
MDLSLAAYSSSSSSSSSTHSFTHDVFLSFRGADTRNNFTGHLYSNLDNKGIKTFIDNDLTRGEDITEGLLEVIEGSRISIVVFSANYASSKWCLDELVKIFQCKESKQQIVYPIFYKVDPSEIRYQKGQVGDGIAHLSKYEDNLTKVGSWKAALTQAATLSGWHISDGGHEANVIDEIVKVISTKIMKCTPLDVATHPVGIESRVEDIIKLLNVEQGDPHMVGIWGIGGIGKTTLAKAVYNSISHKFEHSCFLKIVKEKSHGGLVEIQNNFLSKIIERNPPNVANVDEGITVLKQNLRQKRVLLVLDDVDSLDQLKKLAGRCDWFGPRSRIIITTRDTNCLSAHEVNSIYEVKELNHQEASKLFNFNAFKRNICLDDFFELANEAIHYAKGIPLVLEVLGADLCSKEDKDEWKEALEYYKRYPNQEIKKTLQRSYEALPDRIKEVFLHIACFFKGDKQSYVIHALQSCDLYPKIALKVLVEKALIKIEKDNRIWMHDHLEDMGKEIVRQEFPDEKGKRSRLWLYEDVCEVLEENKGTDKIKGIMVRCFYPEKICLNSGSFTNLKNLQIFIVHGRMLYGEGVDYLPNHLRFLHLTLQAVKGFNLKDMRYLKSIKLSFSNGLTRIPDMSGLTSLEYLELSNCFSLVEVHPSVGRLDKLVILKLTHCVKLQMFQERINLKSLETLDLSYCRLLKFVPEIEGNMKFLNRLDLSRTNIKELPCSVGNLTGLKSLSLSHCGNLTNVPSSIFYGLQRLEDLDLRCCYNLVTFPAKSESLPPPVFSTTLTRLQVDLSYCERLEEISEFPREIACQLEGCGSLERVSYLSKILESKDSKMFGRLDLTTCPRLCDNLARGVVFHVAKKRKMTLSPFAGTKELMGEAHKLAVLLILFFSGAKSEEFQVEFPVSGPIPFPNWFTCCRLYRELIIKEHEFCFEIPQNSNWYSKGLALCIQSRFPEVSYSVYINGVKFDEIRRTRRQIVWVHYIPLDTVIRRVSRCGMPPPDMFRVMFRFEDNSYGSAGSCGVHLIEDL